jgi:hypothetical protein
VVAELVVLAVDLVVAELVLAVVAVVVREAAVPSSRGGGAVAGVLAVVADSRWPPT